MIDEALFTTKRGVITPKHIRDVFSAVGIKHGDIVMVHAQLFTLGRTTNVVDKGKLADAFIEAFMQAVGPEGIIIFPTFTLSVCKSGLFDVNETKSEMGLLSENARTRYSNSRIHHPFFSVSILGEQKDLFSLVNLNTCFGENSFFDILHKLNVTNDFKGKVKFVTLGIDVPPGVITYIHSIEEKLAVPYRYHKNFQGTIRNKQQSSPYNTKFFVRDISTEVVFDAEACWNLLKNEDGIKTEPLGDSFVALLPESTIFSNLTRKIALESDFLCKGGYVKKE